MARTAMAFINDTRQYQRELAMMTGEQKARLMEAIDRGERVAWCTTDGDGDIVLVAPRLCFG